MLAGSPFFPTAFKNGAFSVSLNQRNGRRGSVDFLANIGMIAYGALPSCMLIRKTMEVCSDYACAFNKLANDTMIASGYFILAGVKDNEGVVISRDRTASADIATISDDHWNLVQTNEDHFADICRERCQAARDNFQKLTREALTIETGFN